MSETRRPVWQDPERLLGLMSDPHRTGFSVWNFYGPNATPTQAKAVAILSRPNAQIPVYAYHLLALDAAYDTPALRQKITNLQVPERAHNTEHKIQEIFGKQIEAIINESIARCAREGLPQVMVGFGTAVQGGEDVAYLYHPLNINLFSQFYIPPTGTLHILQELVRTQQISSN